MLPMNNCKVISEVITMADMFAPLVAQLKANPKTIVFTEGNDPRILEAASKLLAEGVLKVVMVGNEAECKAAAAAGNFDISAAEIIDPENYAGFDEMVNTITLGFHNTAAAASIGKTATKDENGLSINLYTILFIAFFGIGYGAYYATADMPIPMVADCSDYETYRSGKYIPGIMGTLFSLVDKLVSSLSATVVGIAVSFVGLQSLPTQYDPYTPGMNWVVIVLFCIIPMVAWAATLIAMKGYTLTGAKMKEIQAVNACRRDAVAKGMKLEEAMDKWQTMDQLPAEYRS